MNCFKHSIALKGILSFCIALAVRSANAQINELDQINRVIGQYFDGARGNIAYLDSAFTPQTKIIYLKESNYQEMSFSDYKNIVTKRGTINVTAIVKSIEYRQTIAKATVEMQVSDKKYVDYLALLNIKGHWKIVNKLSCLVP